MELQDLKIIEGINSLKDFNENQIQESVIGLF